MGKSKASSTFHRSSLVTTTTIVVQNEAATYFQGVISGMGIHSELTISTHPVSDLTCSPSRSSILELLQHKTGVKRTGAKAMETLACLSWFAGAM